MSPRRAPTESPGVRRQERGRRRMEAILDAAEELVAEVGYDQMGMNAIAGRAGISPGSLYQFFRSKTEILDGLLGRYDEVLEGFWGAQLAEDITTLPLTEVVDRLVDAMVAFKAERPAFWALFHGSMSSEDLASAARRLDERLIARIDGVFAARAPHLADDRRRLITTVAVATAKSLMVVIVDRAGTVEQAAVAGELKRVLIGYLEPALAPS